MISRTSMKSQMKGNKMPIKLVPLNQNNKDDQKMRVLKKKPAKKKELRAKSGGSIKKMKKGGVIKAGMGKMLETFSPAYSMMKGKGPIAEMLGMAKAKPMKAALTKEEREAQAQQQIMANKSGSSNRMTPMTGMMGGGSVKKKRSIDGIATKGRTRG